MQTLEFTFKTESQPGRLSNTFRLKDKTQFPLKEDTEIEASHLLIVKGLLTHPR